VNWNHLQAVLWLRWRILVNRIRRGGKIGNAIFGVLMFLAACASLGFFALAFGLGLTTLREATPFGLMAAWAGLALGFLFFWMIGLLTDLQRSDSMSFKHLLHLPVSLRWVFLYNYLSSYVSLAVGIFLPAMIGLSLAMAIRLGPAMLLSLPLALAYLAMVTALTYQLRGWLARLMEDKRRGRTIVAAITMGFVLILQAPNLVNLSLQGSSRAERRRVRAERMELKRTVLRDGPDRAEAEAALARLDDQDAADDAEFDQRVSMVAMWLPVGWLPYGVRAGFERRWLPSSLCLFGMLAIGAWSLRRSYGTTMDFAIGKQGRAEKASLAGPKPAGKKASEPSSFVERTLPFASDAEAGIALATLRSLLRAPEAKLLLLSPVLLLCLFGFMLAKNPALDQLQNFAPAMSLGAAGTGLLSIMQLIQNQFGLDRAGFRAFVLSPVSRASVLRAKNLAIAPLGIGVGLLALVGLEFFIPVDVPHFLGACLQVVSAYLLFCMIGNMISILGPMRLKENALKAEGAGVKTILWQMLSLVLIPIAVSPLLIPFGVELLLRMQERDPGSWLYLALHALGLLAIAFLYRWVVGRQGDLLQEREQRILEVLTRV